MQIQALLKDLETGRLREEALKREMGVKLKDSASSVDAYKGEALKALEEAKYLIFQQLMDAFEQERRVMEGAHKATQGLLQQAARDVQFLTSKNGELSTALNQAIYYEPPIQPR
mmetsp:Transcript_5640/g.12404  ORF Transcript_5640/g.12404 Transcript_5640/m.12404 type:complete len:114 (-) Transcript_5640:25-366(-)